MKRILMCIAGAALALSACGEDGPGVPGTLTATLVTPVRDDGAALVRVNGPGLGNVTLVSTSHLVFWRLTGPDEARVIVIGHLVEGPLFRFDGAQAGSKPSAYSATLVEIAGRDDQLRVSLAPYGIGLTSAR